MTVQNIKRTKELKKIDSKKNKQRENKKQNKKTRCKSLTIIFLTNENLFFFYWDTFVAKIKIGTAVMIEVCINEFAIFE